MEYLISCNYFEPVRRWIVFANSKEDGINSVWDKHIEHKNLEIKEYNKTVGYRSYRPIYKKDFEVKEIDKMRKEQGDVIDVEW